MRLLITGTIVDKDENAWSFNGGSGTTLKAYVQTGSAREAAVGVRVSDRQYGAISVGDRALWAVEVRAFSTGEGREPKMQLTLDRDQDPNVDADVFVRSSAGI